MAVAPSSRFSFAPDLALRVHGDRRVQAHFRAEYDTASVVDDSGPVQIEAVYGSVGAATSVSGGHKTVRWRVSVAEPGADPLAVGLELHGWPRSFALSLTQGYFVEPVISVAAARRQLVLLPSAGLVAPDGAVLIIGRSGSGKSSLTVRALAAGRRALGDDQVLVAATGACRAFPRRIRLYSDLWTTAPFAYRRLPAGVRAGLGLRRALRTATRGYVAPPVRVPVEAFTTPYRDALPLKRLIVIERDERASALSVIELERGDAIRHALGVLREQRARLAAAAGSDWRNALAETEHAERATLVRALSEVPIERIQVPAAWPADRAIAALTQRIEIE